MLKTHLRVAWRGLRRQPGFSGINLLGLTLGTLCCLYIVLYVRGHYGYDTHHQDADQLYRLTSELHIPGEADPIRTARSSPPLAPAIQAEYPEVLASTRVCPPMGVDQQLLEVGDYRVYHDPGYYVDSTFFSVFDYHFLDGQPHTALDEPFSVAVSAKLAKQLFGRTQVVGEEIAITGNDERALFTVGGVFDERLGKSHLEADLFLTMNSNGIGQYIRSSDSWAGNNFLFSYFRLRPGADQSSLSSKLPAFLERHGGEQMREMSLDKYLHLQPVSAIHTGDTLSSDMAGNVGNSFLNILLLIAGFIQLIACINFINLSTARANRRAQEVGLRKIVGAGQRSLLTQFLVESFVLAGGAMLLAIPLLQLSLPYLNQLTGAAVALRFSSELLLLVGGLLVGTTLLAGLYPAALLTTFKPMEMLRGGTQQRGKQWVRQALVIGQLTIATGLIMVAILIHQQVDYLLEKDLGFEKDQKLVLNLYGVEGGNQVVDLKNEIARITEVQSVSAMSQPPGQNLVSDLLLYKQGETMEEGDISLMMYVDLQYFETLKIDLVAGRSFRLSDTVSERGIHRVVVNESLLRSQNLTLDEAIGTVLYSQWGDLQIENTIIGVVEDYNHQSLSQDLRPAMFLAEVPQELNYLIADISTTDYTGVLAKVESAWKAQVPTLPFRYSFLNEDIDRLYDTEQTLSDIISTFTILAILIACLGLFGLSVYAVEQRQKEISIRKVLGASITGLVGLLSREFILLVGVALLLAAPLAYYIMDRWLENFAYHTAIHWWIFGVTALVAVGLAALTISIQSARAALANPIDSLKE